MLTNNAGASGFLVLGCAMLALQGLEPALPDYVAVGLLVIGTLLVAVASVWLGRTSVRQEAAALIAPLALPPFRRTLSLIRALLDASTLAEEKRRALRREAAKGGSLSIGSVDAALEVIETHAIISVRQADDALEEWELILPEEVREFRERGEANK
ncbi:MAG: hypothetical protein WEB29_03090 [Chloroflexota bacterium]